jgi:hypothetical protein
MRTDLSAKTCALSGPAFWEELEQIPRGLPIKAIRIAAEIRRISELPIRIVVQDDIRTVRQKSQHSWSAYRSAKPVVMSGAARGSSSGSRGVRGRSRGAVSIRLKKGSHSAIIMGLSKGLKWSSS